MFPKPLRHLTTAACALAAAAACLTAFAPTAEAASYDGKWPSDTKCVEDGNPAFTPKTIPGTHGNAVIALMYSKACRTVWAEVVSWPDADVDRNKIKGFLHRNSDGKEYQVNSAWEEGIRVSKMLNDANVSSYAGANYNGGSTVKTSSY